MFFKKSGYVLLIFSSLIISYPSFSQTSITVEQNPQEFKSPIPSPISAYIDEIDKTNQSLKQDLLLLRNQVDNLSKELNQNKSQEPDSEIKKTIEDNWNILMVILFFMVIALAVALYFIYSKLRKNNEKSIYFKVNELSEQTKKEVLKELKIKEAESHVEIQTIAQIKQDEFEYKLDEKYSDYIEKLSEEQNKQIDEFENTSKNILQENLENVNNELNKIIEQKNKDFNDKINKKFPAQSTEEMIEKIAEDSGVISKISDSIENTVMNSITQKIEELNSDLEQREQKILTDIQKAQLANNHFNIGNMYLKDNKFEEAIEEFHLALRIDHSFYGAYINLGKAYEATNHTENAIDMYNQAISIRPEHYKAYFNLGNLLNSVKKYDDAEFMFKRALELNKDNPKIYNNLGISCQLMNKNSAARDHYLKAISINRNYPDAYINLAKVETLMGNDRGIYQIAERYMKKNNASQETFYSVKDLAYSTMS